MNCQICGQEECESVEICEAVENAQYEEDHACQLCNEFKCDGYCEEYIPDSDDRECYDCGQDGASYQGRCDECNKERHPDEDDD